jgi:hypothetical protein
LVDTEERRLMCACRACALLFDGVVEKRYRAVPDRVLRDPALELRSEELARLGIPVGLAFCYYPSSLGRWVGFFPSPAGSTEAELSESGWRALEERSTLFRLIERDVEALLVRSPREGPAESFLVPIDTCYALVGEVRAHWHGIDGGDEVRSKIDAFFHQLEQRSELIRTPGGAP